MRVTNHYGRYGRSGVYSAKHNDRQFDISKTEHIDANKHNVYWNIFQSSCSFEDVERKFYEEHFSQHLKIRNLKYLATRNYCKQKSVDDYRTSKQTCPEEVILQVGNIDVKISDELAQELFKEQIRWLQATFKQCVILDYAIHYDETTTHCHIRQVWIGHDEYGNEVVSQKKALAEMNIGQDTAGTRYDNPKKVYTAMCREHFEALCESKGICVNKDRLQASKTGKDLLEYKFAKDKAKLAELEQKVQTANNEIALAEEKLAAARLNLEELRLQAETERKEFEADKEEAKQALLAEYDNLKNAAKFFDRRGLQIVGQEELEAIKLRAANAQLKKENEKFRKMLRLETRQQEQMRRQQAVNKFTR